MFISGTFLNNIKQPDVCPNSFCSIKKGTLPKKNKSQYGRYRVAKQPSTETTRPPPRRQKLATHPSSQSLCLSEPAVHQHTPRVLLRQKLRCPFSKKKQKKFPSSCCEITKKKGSRKKSPLDIHMVKITESTGFRFKVITKPDFYIKLQINSLRPIETLHDYRTSDKSQRNQSAQNLDGS